MKKIFSYILTICMLFSLLPALSIQAKAAELTVGTGGSYSTLSSALAAVGNGDTITLLGDITETVAFYVPAGLTFTIDGDGHTVTGANVASGDSCAIKLAGSSTVILKNITLKGGNTATASASDFSIGLFIFDYAGQPATNLTVVSEGLVTAEGGNGYFSQGIYLNSAGSNTTINLTTASGGTGTRSYGAYNNGPGTINVSNAAGGIGTEISCGVQNSSTGTVNAANAGGGSAGAYNTSTGVVNVQSAGNASTALGVCNTGNGTINVGTATGSTHGASNIGAGIINAQIVSGNINGTVNTAVSVLTLNKGYGDNCVLNNSIISSSGSTWVGTLPGVTMNGRYSAVWYTDSNLTSQFTESEMTNSTTDLYSIYNLLHTISGTITNSGGNGLAATLQLYDSFGKAVSSVITANANGTYTISDVVAGSYILAVCMSGYASNSITGITITNSDLSGQDLTLYSAPTITTTTLTAGKVGEAYNQSLAASGDTPVTWAVSGTLPPGLTHANGTISGTPTTVGTYSFTATATNSAGSDSETLSITIEDAFVAVTNILGVPSTATVGVNLTLAGTVEPSEATNKAIVWSIKNAGTTNASLNGGTLSTTAAGTVTVTATITNGASESTDYTQDFTIVMNDATYDFAVTGGTAGTDYTYDGTTLTFIRSGTYTVSMVTSGYTTTTEKIVVACNSGDVNITLSGVNIDKSSSGGCAFELQNTSHVNLTLSGTNLLKSSNDCAGLQVPENATLSITGSDSDSLRATGGNSGAGIGGGWNGNGGTVNISGGTVTASSASTGAGIGGGFSGNGGAVTIFGGTVTASSVSTGAGIGGGLDGDGGTVNISGGSVTASSDYGAGIGGGYSQGNGANGGTVNVSGGTVTASGARGSGIGGGGGWNGNGGDGGPVTISGGTVAASSSWGAGIGGGSSINTSNGGDGGAVYISGGSVKATGGNGSENIGKALGGSVGTLKNSGSGSGENIYLTTVTLDGVSVKSAVTSLTTSLSGSAYSFGTNDMYTDASGKLYLYLPENTDTTSAQADGYNYTGAVTTTNDPLTSLGTLTLDNPTVTNVTPDSMSAAISGNLVITFSEPMDTLVGTVSLDGGATTLTGGSWSNGDTAYTVSYSGLSYSTTYNLAISGFKDTAANTMADDGSHSFTTCAESYYGDVNIITVANSGDTTTVTVTAKATINADGTLNVSLTESIISQAMKKAEESTGDDGNIVLEILINGLDSASGLTLNISAVALGAITDRTVSLLTVTTQLGTFSFNDVTLAQIAGQAGGDDVEITVSSVDPSTLSDETRQLIGTRPTYDFTITSGDTVISDFKGGTATVSLPYTPAEGEITDSIIIFYISDSGELVAVPNCLYDAETGNVTFTTNHFSAYAVAYNYVSFTDVSGWYEDCVDFVAARGIMNGIGGSEFSPTGTMTRAMFVTVLYRLSGNTGSYTNTFSDVAIDVWYENSVAWAAENGIVNGVGFNKFSPDSNITREQLAVMLYNYAKYKGYDLSVGKDTNILSYKDSLDISEYACSSLQWTCGAGILNGDDCGNLNPQSFALRAEAAAMLQRFIKNVTC